MQIIGDMPEDLRSEVLLYVYREFLSASAFTDLPRECRRRVALGVCSIDA